jgi:predicted enzyme related to lactoylglutathione lyase
LCLRSGVPQIALYSGQIGLYSGRESDIRDDIHWFIAIDVVDIEQRVAELRDRGVHVGTVEAVPGGRAAQFMDPEGNVIEILEPVD